MTHAINRQELRRVLNQWPDLPVLDVPFTESQYWEKELPEPLLYDPELARRLFEEAIEAGSTNAPTYHKYAGLLQSKRETSSAIANWKKAIEFDPLTGSYYYALGRAIEDEDEEEGARLKALGLEIDPESASGWWWDD